MKVIRALPLLLALALVACGGKKSNPAAATPTVNLSGVAYKGVLKSAEVSAHEVVNGVVSTTALKTVVTDANGNYSLDLPATTNPVVVKVKTTASTKMLDESNIQGDGSFAETSPPAGVEMRSYVAQLQEASTVMINPVTELALVLAEKTKQADGTTAAGLTADVLLMAKAVVREAMAGDDAFTTTPPSRGSEIQANAVHAVMVGLAHLSRTDTACDMACQIAKTSGKNTLDLAATLDSSGRLALGANAITALQQPIKDAANQSVVALAGTDFATAMQTAASNVSDASVSSTSPTVAEIDARNGFDAFLNAMRDGFKLTDSSLRAEADVLKERYQGSALAASSHMSDLLNMIEDQCLHSEGLGCGDGSGMITWTGSSDTGYSFSGTRNGNDVSGQVSGSRSNLMLSDLKVSSNGTPLFTAATITVNENSSDTGDSKTLNGTVVGYDTAAGSSRKATMALNNVTATSSLGECPPIGGMEIDWFLPCKYQSGGLSGKVVITFDAGDTFIGNLEIAFDEWRNIRGNPPYGLLIDYVGYPTKFNLDLTATGSNKTLLTLDFQSNSAGRPPLGDDAPISADNFSSNTNSFKLGMLSGSELEVTLQHTTWNQVIGSFRVKAGGNQMTVATTYSANVQQTEQHHCRIISGTQFCADTLNVASADNTYTAALQRVNGKVSGDIKKGELVVAQVKDGIVYANGKKVSLY